MNTVLTASLTITHANVNTDYKFPTLTLTIMVVVEYQRITSAEVAAFVESKKVGNKRKAKYS